jgi:hypothetical protein
LRPEPVAIGSCKQPASGTSLKPPSPSVTTFAPRFTIRRVILLMLFFVNRAAGAAGSRDALPGLRGLDRHDERPFDAAVERPAMIALQHRLPELLMHLSGRVVGCNPVRCDLFSRTL